MNAEFQLTPLVVYEESEKIDKPQISKERVNSRRRDYEYEREVYTFTITYTYSGQKYFLRLDQALGK